MIERGLLNQDSDQTQQQQQPPQHEQRREGEREPPPPPPGADTATEMDFKTLLATSGSDSKLNKLLQTPTINKINYMENYKLICPSSTSITSSATNPNQKSVIQKGPPSATVTSAQQLATQTKEPSGGSSTGGTATNLG